MGDSPTTSETPTTFLGRLRSRRMNDPKVKTLEHGWEVPLKCNACGQSELPVYDGRTAIEGNPSGKQPLVYANLKCRHCGNDLKQEATEEVVRLFATQRLDPHNRRLLSTILVGAAIVSVVGYGEIFMLFVIPAPWRHMWWMGFVLVYVYVTTRLLPGIDALRGVCTCGKPSYKFMGRLGLSYCFRCSTCGKLLRLRY